MVVSDKKDFLLKYYNFFRDCNYNVHAARNSFECGHSYFEGKIRIDLVILDNDMWRSNAVLRDIMDWDKNADILVLGGEKYLGKDACDAIVEGRTYDNYMRKSDGLGDILHAASGMLRNKISKYVTLADAVQKPEQEVLVNA
jgi:DNA-binding NtrC family response regulator